MLWNINQNNNNNSGLYQNTTYNIQIPGYTLTVRYSKIILALGLFSEFITFQTFYF